MVVKVFVNASTITVGGGVQAAVSFIEEAARLQTGEADFLFAVSPAIKAALAADVRSDSRLRQVSPSPAPPVIGAGSRRELRALERDFLPHVLYSMGFPSYVRFDAVEVGRYTNGWEICDAGLAMSSLPPWQRVFRHLRTAYRLRWARHATYFETQTEVAKQGIVQRLGVAPERVMVAPNSVNPRFLVSRSTDVSKPSGGPARVLCLSAAFRHKNLTIIPEVAELLRRAGCPCEFRLTLPHDSALWREIRRDAVRRDVLQLVSNAGLLSLDDCVSEFGLSRALFLPTLFEIFSATYIEAMAMDVPIITTDLDFARDICRDAAAYYDPLSPVAAATAIRRVLTDEQVRADLVRRGRARLAAFPAPAEKNADLLDWLLSIGRNAGRPHD